MKKLGLSLVVVSMMFACPAFAEEPAPAAPADGSTIIPLGTDHDRLCNDAKAMQSNRIRDLKSAVEYDKVTEAKLLEGATARETDANAKDVHAKQWRDFAAKQTDTRRQNAFNNFATWLESEAKTDRRFASERRIAAGQIGKGWREAQSAIAGHEKFLADLNANC